MSTTTPDPLADGSRAYRVTLLSGMVLTFVGVVMLVIHMLSGDGGIWGPAVAVLGAGLLLHLISIGIRMRDAKRHISQRKGSHL